MTDRQDLSAVAERLLLDRFGARASRPEPLAAGEWSQAFALTLDGAEVVLRVGAHGEDFAKDAIVAVRTRTELGAPAVLHRGTIDHGVTPGLSFAISRRAFGVAFDDQSDKDTERSLPSLLRSLDLIAASDVSGSAGYGLWTPEQIAPHPSWSAALLAIEHETPRVPGWRAALQRSDLGLQPFEAGLTALHRLAPDLPDERKLVHADLLSRNVLVAGADVSAVLDWGNALYGDHLYDAAWLIYWWPWHRQGRKIDIRSHLFAHWRATDGVPADAERRLTACLLHVGLDAIAYCAFKRRWDDARRNSAAVAALADTVNS